MIAMVPAGLVTVMVALLVVAACVAARHAFDDRPNSTSRRTRRPSSISANGWARAGAAGLVVLLLTRWPSLALAVAALVVLWPVVMRDERADRERQRVEALAKWLEDLRDTVRGSAVGAEEALDLVATRPPGAIAEPLRTYASRMRSTGSPTISTIRPPTPRSPR
jgi:hypothetical protein